MSPTDGHPITTRRQRLGWSQVELARRAGLPRSSVSAVESGRLTPAVTAALALASALECSVEELFAGPAAPAPAPGWAWEPAREPARFWEAEVSGRRLLFPTEAPVLNSQPHDGVWERGVLRGEETGLASRTLVVACCDPSAGLLANAYARESGFRMIVLPRGGAAALDLLRRGLIHAAGLHHSTATDPDCNGRMAREAGGPFTLLHVLRWETGLATASASGWHSVASVLRQSRHWALREAGSAARECLEGLLDGRKTPGRVVGGHSAVAESVRFGWADAGVCVRLSAEENGLDFLPVRTEQLDFCLTSGSTRDPRIVALTRLLRSRTHRQLLSELPGYDARGSGDLFAA